MRLELVTEAQDTETARTFILDFSTFQTVSDVLPDATSSFWYFCYISPNRLKWQVTWPRPEGVRNNRRTLQQEGTRAASWLETTKNSKEMKKGTKGTCFFTRQGYVTIRLLKMKRMRKATSAWDYQSPSTTLHAGSVQHTCILGCICLKERECWELARFSTRYPVREAFLEKAWAHDGHGRKAE